jgi:hypothetical protein
MIALLLSVFWVECRAQRFYCNFWSFTRSRVSCVTERKRGAAVVLVASLAMLFSTEVLAQRGRIIETVRPFEHGLPGSTGAKTHARNSNLARLNEEVRKPDPNPRTIDELIRQSSSDAPGEYLSWISQAIRNNSRGTHDEPIDQSSPNVLLRRPVEAKFDLLVSYLRTKQLDSFLHRSLDRSQVKLLSFVFSTSGRSRIFEKIPLQNQARGQHFDKIKSGDFDTLDANMFASLSGQFVIAVGHIVSTSRGNAFEVRTESGHPPKYVELQSLEQAAQIHGFDFIPLGCETADSAAIGTVTKITDLNAIDGIARVIAKDGRASWKEILTDLSSPDMKLAIDITKITDPKKIPIEYVDRNDKTYRPPSTVSRPGTNLQSAGEIVAKEQAPLSKACLISEDGLRRSRAYAELYPNAVHLWWTSALLLTTLTMLGATIDCMRLRAIPPVGRVKYFAFHSCLALLTFGLIYLTAHSGEWGIWAWLLFVGAFFKGAEEVKDGLGCITLLVAVTLLAGFVYSALRTGTDISPLGWSVGLAMLGAGWGVLLAARPDYRFAKYSSIPLIASGLSPWFAAVSVMVFRGNCWLVDIAPI